MVRRILKEIYPTAYDGIPGNDDCGEMSSWAGLSMMGIYTVDPASLAYELTSPLFQKNRYPLASTLSWQDIYNYGFGKTRD